jgi:hypothetical protein
VLALVFGLMATSVHAMRATMVFQGIVTDSMCII